MSYGYFIFRSYLPTIITSMTWPKYAVVGGCVYIYDAARGDHRTASIVVYDTFDAIRPAR